MMPNVTSGYNNTTSAKYSKTTILNHKDSYCVGEHLMVRLDMYDHLGKRKEYGGDFLRARIYSLDLKAGASGSIKDFRNGTYLVNFTLFWEGNVRASILLIHPSEGVSALWAARKKGYGKIGFTGKFLNGTSEVTTECGFNLTRNAELCEYLDERDQEAFYCLKPKHVPCDAFVSLQSYNKPISYLTTLEQSLLKRFKTGIEIPQLFGAIQVVQCKALEYLDIYPKEKLQKLLAVDLARHIWIQSKKHGHPYVGTHGYTVKDHSYVARDIDNVAGDRDTTIVICLGQHFRPFPIQLFIRRVVNIRRAVQRLLLRSPDMRVIIKGENIREMEVDQERFGDIQGYAQSVALKEVFRDLNVAFIDAWDITVAYNTKKVHPLNHVVWEEVNMFLSYICCNAKANPM
ncbi:NXPE family member 4-like isoform X2 [Sceloporus undulatus]|uniref:NXPE family member 4-like isoform X2 n=1 Tax=Sceloporus undulatus TaxID=8520 RepID=UPI001C4BF88D|nr:NXPE family member 4-like isoform X2 [Sceloporus undulatus]